MGGGGYSRDVLASSSSRSFSDFSDKTLSKTKSLDNKLAPKKNKDLVCNHRNPIVVAFDVTGSMGNDAKVVYDKMPMFFGQILYPGKTIEEIKKLEAGKTKVDTRPYLLDPAVSFAAVGDAYSDQAPIQICEFDQGIKLDKWLEKIWLEGRGGGQYRETYELVAYYYARHCQLQNPEKAFFFFIGDEGFYNQVSGDHIQEWMGEKTSKSVDSTSIFKELRQKFEVFRIHRTYGRSDADVDILRQWRKALGPERVLVLGNEAKAVADIMLGAIALGSGTRTLAGYMEDMRGKEQDAKRLPLVESVLSEFALSLQPAIGLKLPAKSKKGKSSPKVKRL